MTRLTKAVVREVTRDGKTLLVKLAPEGLYMREKGTRTWFGPASWGSMYMRCVEVVALSNRMEKALTKRPRRVSRGLLSIQK